MGDLLLGAVAFEGFEGVGVEEPDKLAEGAGVVAGELDDLLLSFAEFLLGGLDGFEELRGLGKVELVDEVDLA